MASCLGTYGHGTPVNAPLHHIPIHHVRGRLSVATNHAFDTSSDSSGYAVVYLSSSEPAVNDRPHVLCIQTPQGKRGQHHFLHTVLPQAMSFIALSFKKAVPVCVTCETGTDLSIGVALAALATFFDEKGEFHGEHERKEGVLSTSHLSFFAPKKDFLMHLFDSKGQYQNLSAVDHHELPTSQPLAHHAQTS